MIQELKKKKTTVEVTRNVLMCLQYANYSRYSFKKTAQINLQLQFQSMILAIDVSLVAEDHKQLNLHSPVFQTFCLSYSFQVDRFFSQVLEGDFWINCFG